MPRASSRAKAIKLAVVLLFAPASLPLQGCNAQMLQQLMPVLTQLLGVLSKGMGSSTTGSSSPATGGVNTAAALPGLGSLPSSPGGFPTAPVSAANPSIVAKATP